MSDFEPEHLARLVALSDDLICVGSADGRFFRVSPSWTRTLGYDEATLLNTPFVQFVHPDDAAGTLRQMRRVIRGGRLVQFANRIRHRDGHYRWLRWNVAPALGSTYAYAIARDITELRDVVERLDAERQLRETAERRLSAEIDRARDVQAAFLPAAPLRRPWIHVAGRCIATEEMSGDFLDWHEIDGGVSVTVGDVMGKGFSAALLMATTQAVLRSGRGAHADPAALLDQTNATLADYLG
ncbi:MAG: PAS domain S-box protein, partial [Pyrinomonadaceae bacterium]